MATARALDRRHPAAPDQLVVAAGLALFVLCVYALVVLGGGALGGRTDSPSLGLSVLATAVVALLFAPVQAALERAAARRAGRSPTTPYDVLRRFSEAVTGGHGAQELPARMALLLGQGTGAQWAQVWLTMSDELTLAATWPEDADADLARPDPRRDLEGVDGRGRRCLTVRHEDVVLGVLRLQERPGQPLSPVEARLFRGLAAQAGLALRLVGLRAELEDRRRELVLRADELQASRERLVEAQDAERRRLERDLHDGAQQHLVALAVNLRLVQAVASRAPERASRLLGQQAAAALDAIETLSSLSRGIYPRLLSEEGLVPALRGVATSAVPVTVHGGSGVRPPATVEAALYFCGMEAVQNAVKHSGASGVVVGFSTDDTTWRLSVCDDGTGFEQVSGVGTGLANMRDRLDAVGGSVSVVSSPGHGTTVSACVARDQAGSAHGPSVPSPAV